MNITIRKAELKDKDRLIAISSEIWDGYDYIPNIFDKWVRDDKGEFTVIEVDSKVMGCAKLTELRKGQLWLEGIRVDQSEGGKGYGKLLSEYQLKLAGELGYDTLELGTFIENKASISIIEKRGFERIIDFKFLEFMFNDEKDPTTFKTSTKIRRVSDYKILDRIMNSETLKRNKGYIVFDWTFIRLDEELAKSLLDRGDIYVYEDGNTSNVFVYSNLFAKNSSMFLPFLENNQGIDEIIDYLIYESYKSNQQFISLMTTVEPNDYRIFIDRGFNSYVDVPYDSYVYRFKGK